MTGVGAPLRRSLAPRAIGQLVDASPPEQGATLKGQSAVPVAATAHGSPSRCISVASALQQERVKQLQCARPEAFEAQGRFAAQIHQRVALERGNAPVIACAMVPFRCATAGESTLEQPASKLQQLAPTASLLPRQASARSNSRKLSYQKLKGLDVPPVVASVAALP